MAEEIQIYECNGDRHPEITVTTNIIDQVDTVPVCETCECDPVISVESKEVQLIYLEDKIDSLEINKKNTEDGDYQEHQTELTSTAEQDSGMLISQNTRIEEHSNGEDHQTTLEVECANVPAHDSPEQEEEKEKAQDMFIDEPAKVRSESGEEELLTETEEENTSIETDNDNGQGSCDEQDNGPNPLLLVSYFESNSEQPGNKPDISRHNYSKYDTVSYRKIRRGNTKQRIDEFESMMN